MTKTGEVPVISPMNVNQLTAESCSRLSECYWMHCSISIHTLLSEIQRTVMSPLIRSPPKHTVHTYSPSKISAAPRSTFKSCAKIYDSNYSSRCFDTLQQELRFRLRTEQIKIVSINSVFTQTSANGLRTITEMVFRQWKQLAVTSQPSTHKVP